MVAALAKSQPKLYPREGGKEASGNCHGECGRQRAKGKQVDEGVADGAKEENEAPEAKRDESKEMSEEEVLRD